MCILEHLISDCYFEESVDFSMAANAETSRANFVTSYSCAVTSYYASVASCEDLVAASYRKTRSREAPVVSHGRKSDG